MSKTNDELCINTLRFLAVDAVQQANSGHPGTPMGAAAPVYVLWDRFLKHHPAEPKWPDRDRFILSAGHASAMLYSLLHLTGYDLPLEEIKRFRQWDSVTPGHPEYGLTPGVEATTGPLGQGFANGVGMAIAERWLAEHYNRPGHEIIDHYIYGLVSDGDLMEGVSAEAASMAGHLKLGKIIYIYDDNDISIEGDTAITFTEDVARRFSAYGWHVINPVDGLNLEAVASAIVHAQEEKDRPSLIITKTVIGYGSPHKAGTASAHGEPLGADEVRLSKKRLGWPYAEPFTVPPEAQSHYRLALEKGQQQYLGWQEKLAAYRQAYPKEAARLEGELAGDLPQGWQEGLSDFFKGAAKPMATRAASGLIMNAIALKVHALMGGSADLSPSNKTILKDKRDFDTGSYGGHNMHFGVREHAMGAIANGMALHGGVIPYTATFLIFYDYMRPPVRLAALSGIRVIFIYTHDSVGLGEDGPTHQPIEQLSGLRAVPNLVTLRPADATETAEVWQVALERRNGPTFMALTRQKLPVFNRQESDDQPKVILIATGSEVHIALEAGKLLARRNISARVVSLPSWELFDDQPIEYRHSVLPPAVKARVSMEAASPMGWERYVGDSGAIIGIDRFGASAPGDIIYRQLGLTAQHMADEARRLLGKE